MQKCLNLLMTNRTILASTQCYPMFDSLISAKQLPVSILAIE